jgi:hypothetical protein
MKTLVAPPLLALLAMTTCRELEPAPVFTLPPVTQTGANTLGFVIDGRVWQNFGQSCTFYGCQDNKLMAYVGQNRGGKGHQVQITAGLTSKDYREDFGISLDYVKGPGTYTRHKSSTLGKYNHLYLTSESSLLYENLDSVTTSVTITRFDTVAHIVSGTFEGTLQRQDAPGESRRIQDGRFDLVYNQ